MTHQARLLPDGRLHLQHGPIDLICQAWPAANADTPTSWPDQAAYQVAVAVFPTILPALCAELPRLRMRGAVPDGPVARAMHAAVEPFPGVTPMAAVAGAVADAVLAAMVAAASLARAFVNNGGDIAFHLAPGEHLRCGLVADLQKPALDGTFLLAHGNPSRGIATSGRACKGRGGRSFSLGIADSVTVLARTAAMADAAATAIGNAVDLPGHPAIIRRPARTIDPDSDLGDRLVTLELGPLTPAEICTALDAGRRTADALRQAGLIDGAVLTLRGAVVTCLAQELEAA